VNSDMEERANEWSLVIMNCKPKIGKTVFDSITMEIYPLLKRHFDDVVIVNGEFNTLTKDEANDLVRRLNGKAIE